jgi:hypothetical protein
MSTFNNAVVAGVGTTASNVYAATNTTVFLELDVANSSAADVTANVTLTQGATTAYLVKMATIPTGSAIQVIAGQKIVLKSGDYIRIQSSAASSLDAVGSVLEGV